MYFRLIIVFCVLVLFCTRSSQGQFRKERKRFNDSVIEHKDLVYSTVAEKELRLDLYQPKGLKSAPLIVWIHGGGWRNGSKGGNPPAFRFLSQGYIVASINYRLSHEEIFPAQIQDCKSAIRWLRANAQKYNINPNQIGVWGSSAGGHLVALLGTSGGVEEFEKGEHLDVSSRVQAVCDYYGPTDFLQMGGRHNDARSPESLLIGGAIQENKEQVARANPMTYITKDDPPIFIVHGSKDFVVPVSQSKIFFDELQKQKVPSALHIIDGAGHGGRGFSDPIVLKKVTSFFDLYLKKSGKATP